MAITMTEQMISRRWDSDSAGNKIEVHYQLTGSDDNADILDHVIANAPATYTILGLDHPRSGIRIEPEVVDTATGTGFWHAIVDYKYDVVEPAVGEELIEFDTTGGTQHITQSLATSAKYPASGADKAPDCKGAIGVTHDSVEGADVVVPVYTYTEVHFWSNAQVTDALVTHFFNATGKVNNATWNGWSAGELLFLGATGSRRGTDKWEIGLRFSASKNRTNFNVGDIAITGGKLGWELMWVRYADKPSEGKMVKQPIAVYIEQVYDSYDFDNLYPA
jgi:hypothetical protein